jgi:hypothetical protein
MLKGWGVVVHLCFIFLLIELKSSNAPKISFIEIPSGTTGSFRKNYKLYMLITKVWGALSELKQVAKFY